MSEELIEIEEEEFTSQLTMPVFKRIASLLRPHWKWVVGFFITIAATSSTDAYFTYLNVRARSKLWHCTPTKIMKVPTVAR